MVAAPKYTGAITALEHLPSTLREMRRVRGLSLRAVARETGLDHSTITHIEQGRDCRLTHALVVMRWLNGA